MDQLRGLFVKLNGVLVGARRVGTLNIITGTGLGAESSFDERTGHLSVTIAAEGSSLDEQVSASDRILGRDTAGAGDVEELTVTGGLEFTGSLGIQRSALTGDVTCAAGSGATTIANDAVTTAKIANNQVTFAKVQQITTDRLLGRDTASTGNVEEISVGGGLEFSGSTAIQRSALTGDVTASAGSNACTIPNDTVTNAKLANMAEGTTKGRAAGAGTGDPTDRTDQSVVDSGLNLIRLGPTLIVHNGGVAMTIGTIPLTTLFAAHPTGGRAFVRFTVYALSDLELYGQEQTLSVSVRNNDPGGTVGDATITLESGSAAFADDLVTLTVDIVDDELRLRGEVKTASWDPGVIVEVYAVAQITHLQVVVDAELATAAMLELFGADAEALWIADAANVTLSGSDVATWIDLTGNANTIAQSGANKPIWEATGWNGNGSIQFSSSGTPDELAITAGGTVRTCINGGDDIPVSVLMLIEPIGFGTVPIIGWYNAGTPELQMLPQSATDTRWTNITGATTGASNIAISAAQHAHGVSTGDGGVNGVDAWVDDVQEISNGSWDITGGNACDAFRVTGNASFRLRALMVVSRKITNGEYQAWRLLAEAISS
jgi:hypothetical protein